MKASNSFISNSELGAKAVRLFTIRRFFWVGSWMLLWLVVIDVAINVFFAMPKSPLVEPSRLQRYFEYGRSVEGKLRKSVGTDKASTSVINYAGWLVNDEHDGQPTVASSPSNILVAAYGQSFTQQIGNALQLIAPQFEFRFKLGPGAPLSHSYAFYKMDSGHQHADVVLLGILASALQNIMAPTIATINFEMAAPYTYPIYSIKNGNIYTVDPIVHSLEELRLALSDHPELWHEYLAMMRAKATTYNSWIFESDLFDYSSLGRLVRRGIGQKHIKDVTARYWNVNGFNNADGLLDIANGLITDLVADVRARGQLPYILLIQDKGYKDHLAKVFETQLKKLDVPYLSTHTIVSSTDPRNFVSDGHFTPEMTKKIAYVLHEDLLNKMQSGHDKQIMH